jgi:hypothetical protein
MSPDSKPPTVRSLDRINLRLPGETFEAIDASRSASAGTISRDTWITEAIEEKLTCNQRASVETDGVSNDA